MRARASSGTAMKNTVSEPPVLGMSSETINAVSRTCAVASMATPSTHPGREPSR